MFFLPVLLLEDTPKHVGILFGVIAFLALIAIGAILTYHRYVETGSGYFWKIKYFYKPWVQIMALILLFKAFI